MGRKNHENDELPQLPGGNRERPLTEMVRPESSRRRTHGGFLLTHARNIVETVREPLLVLDRALHVKMASRAFYSTFGVSANNTLGRFLYDLGNRQWNVPALRTLLQEVLTEGKEFDDFEVAHEFPGLGRRVMLLNARKLWTPEEGEDLILLAIEDITQRKRVLDELVRWNEDLQRFVCVAAHDLRSPLNAALNLCRLFAITLDAKFDEEEREMLRTSIDSLERMGVLMNDLLTYSASGAVLQGCTLVAFEEPIRVAIANLQQHIEESKATITVGELPYIQTNRTQMALLLQNLIGNAIKYRREESPLRISIEAVPVGDHYHVSVADNGQGFPPEQAAYIFEPFRRLAHRPEIKGSGIGLAICKRIVERWGGRIWAESIPGQGSTFFFTVPAIAALSSNGTDC
jgi:signal transduction histidine kinase